MPRKSPADVPSRLLSSLDGLPLFAPSSPAAPSGTADGAAAAVPPGGGPVGLSSSHISPQRPGALVRVDLLTELEPAQLSIAIGGNSIRLKGPNLFGYTGHEKPRRSGGGRRGKVVGFSKGSRRNLLHKLGSVDQRRLAHRALMVTLTFGPQWDADHKTWKLHLQAFDKRLRRKYPDASTLWRMEPQERGAPHFHLLVFNVRYLSHEWVGENWAAITNGNPAACSRTERVRSWRGVMSYASKYLAKADVGRGYRAGPAGDVLRAVGRQWGVFNGRKLPSEVRSYAVTLGQFFTLRRLLVRAQRAAMRAAGRRGRKSPHAADVGLSAFMHWLSAARLADLVGVDVDAAQRVIESALIAEEIRFMRGLAAEARRDRDGDSPERGREGASLNRGRSRTISRDGPTLG